MKADSLKIYKVFSTGGDIHYALPHFQREYSWGKSEWDMLLNDLWAICDEYEEDTEPEHFLGSLVVINNGTINGVVTSFNLVDGQQRLTTISLLFYALYDIVKEKNPSIAKKIYKILINEDEQGDAHFKLLPTNKYGDRKIYQDIILGNIISQDSESSIPKAYEYLHKSLSQKITLGNVAEDLVFKVVSNCFQVVFITLERDESPYKIFESLNGKGKKLSQADLVRNYIAMRLPPQKQEKVFSDCWENIEKLLQEKRTVGKSRIGELTAFLRHYLAMDSRVLCNEEHIYARFRDRFENDFSEIENFIAELKNLSRFAEYYDKLLRPENEKSIDIKNALIRLNVFDISTAYPFLLAAYDDFSTGKIKPDEFLELLNILENYMVRRFVTHAQTSYLNKMFPSLLRDITTEKENEAISFCDATRRIIVNKEYPTDDNVKQAIQKTKLYSQANQKKIVLVLEIINRYLSKDAGGYTVLNGLATIEHVLPQTLKDEWKESLGDDFEYIYQTYLHTLGNLTLITSSWNSELSNSIFYIKKEKLCQHALKLNTDYFSRNISEWNEQSILDRAEFISEKFLQIWNSLGTPSLSQEYSGRKPVLVTIQGESISISPNNWNQFSRFIVTWILNNHPTQFVLIRKNLDSYFKDDVTNERYPKSWYQLENGVFIYNSLSAKGHISLCTRMLKIIDITENDWNFEIA